jgi:hypothetical protein
MPDWLAANPAAAEIVAAAVAAGLINVIYTPDVSYEISNAPLEQQIELSSVLSEIGARQTANWLPRFDQTAVFDMSRFADEEAIRLYDALAALPAVRGFDPEHVINAVREHCDVLVTNDKRLRKKQSDIQVVTGSALRFVSPEEWIAELRKLPAALPSRRRPERWSHPR